MSFADLDFPVSAPDNLSSSVSCCRLLSAEYLVPLLACTPPSRKMWTSLHTKAGHMVSAIHAALLPHCGREGEAGMRDVMSWEKYQRRTEFCTLGLVGDGGGE